LFVWLRRSGAEASDRLYAQESGRPWRPVTPEGIGGAFAVAPDGETVATHDESGSVALFPIDGRAPSRLEGERGRPVHWTGDGRYLLLAGPELFPARIYRRDVISGRVEPWRTIRPADAAGVMNVLRVLVARDDRTYVYQYSRGLNDLYLARGLR
jgi:hypothetical protein